MTNTFDEIFGTVKEFAVKAGEKTTELVDLSKIRLEIASINSDIKKRFEKLGSLTYNQSKNGGGSEDIVLCIEENDALKKRLAECKEKLDSAKKVIRCPECGDVHHISEACFCGHDQPIEFISADNLFYSNASTYEELGIYNDLQLV